MIAVRPPEKCWEFLKIDGAWLTEDEAEAVYGGEAAARAEDRATLCLHKNGVENMDWHTAHNLLLTLVAKLGCRGGQP